MGLATLQIIVTVVLLLAVAAFASSVATAGVLTTGSYPGLTTQWKLPLDMGVQSWTLVGDILFASDEENIYTVNKNGTVYAVRAADGKQLWAVETNRSVWTLQAFPEYPDILYYSTSNNFSHSLNDVRVYAASRQNGTTLGSFELEAYAWGGDYSCRHQCFPALLPTKYGVAYGSEQHHMGSMDPELRTTYWTKKFAGFPSASWFSEFTTAGEVVVANRYLPNHTFIPELVSYDAKTGEEVCVFPNVTYSSYSIDLPFGVSKDGYVWESQVTGSMYNETFHSRLFNVYSCLENQSSVYEYLGSSSIVDSSRMVHYGSDTLILIMLTEGSNGERVWQLKAADMAPVDEFKWVVNLSNPHNLPLSHLQQPVIAQNATSFDVLIAWNAGTLTGVNATSGEILWVFTEEAILGQPSNSQNQLVLPLDNSGTTVLVPNFGGYTLLDLQSNSVLKEAILPAGQLTDFYSLTNSSSGTPFVVFVDTTDGSLVGASL